MKTLTGLVFAAFVASVTSNIVSQSSSSTTPVFKLTNGQSYIYSYNGRLISGIAQDQSSGAILEIQSDIVLQAERQQKTGSHVAMQMMNVRVGRHQGSVDEKLFSQRSLKLDHRSVEEYEEQLSKPIRFFWDQGQIKTFEADRSEPQWSVNIKKSILSLFNVDLKQSTQKSIKTNDIFGRKTEYDQQTSPIVFQTFEDGVNGVCETLYQVISAVDDYYQSSSIEQLEVLNVTKTRDYHKCLTGKVSLAEKTNIDLRGAPAMICDEFDYQTGACIKTKDQEYNSFESRSSIESPINLFNYVKYNITVRKTNEHNINTYQQEKSAQIDSIYGHGKIVYETNGKQMLLITEQNITLLDKMTTEQMGAIRQIRNIILHQDLSYQLPKSGANLEIPYYNLFGDIDLEELKEQLIPSLLQSVVRDIEVPEIEPTKNTMEKIVQLSNAISVMKQKQLESIFEKFLEKTTTHTRNTRHEQMKRKIFLDLLCSCGTSDAALVAKKLFEQNRISDVEAKEIFETIPQNLYQIDQSVVDAYLSLLLNENVQQKRDLAASIGIALGKMINQATENIETYKREQQQRIKNGIHQSWNQHRRSTSIDESQIAQVMKMLEKALKRCQTFHQKVALIETLAHTGHTQALHILAPIVQDKVSVDELPGYQVETTEDIAQERNFIRQIAIYALTHLVRTNGPEVRAVLLPVYQNRLEPYEVRIAAFTVLLINEPSRETLERIASELHSEQNRQVKSFVISSLKTVSKFGDEPAMRKLASDARFALGMAPTDSELGVQYSKMYGFSRYDAKMKQGVNMIVEWVSNNMSHIPRSGYLAVRQNNDHWSNLALEVGYNVKGFDKILKKIAESNEVFQILSEQIFGNWKDSERVLNKRSTTTSDKVQTLQSLKEKLDLNIRGEEEPKGTVFLKLFERTSYYSFDQKSIEQLLEQIQQSSKEIIQQLIQGKDYHYVKVIMPKQLYKVVSSEMGLPVVVTERHPMILSIKLNQAKLQMGSVAENSNESSAQSSSSSSSSAKSTAMNFTVQVEPMIYHTTFNFIFGVTPVYQDAVGTNLEKTTRVAMPCDVSIGLIFNSKNKLEQTKFSIEPRVPQEIFHHHQEARTFVTRAKIAGPPEYSWLQDATVVRKHQVQYKYEREFFKKQFGLGLRLKTTSDSGLYYNTKSRSSSSSSSSSIIGKFEDICSIALQSVFGGKVSNKDIGSNAIHVVLEADEQKPVTGYKMSAHYKKFDLSTSEESDSDEELINSVQTIDEHVDDLWNRNYDYTTNQKSTTSKNVIKKMVKNIIDEWASVDETSAKKNSRNVVAHSVQLMAISKGSVTPRKYLVQALLAHSYDLTAYWTSARAYSNVAQQEQEQDQQTKSEKTTAVATKVCFDSLVSYEKSPSEFYYEPIATQDLQCKIKARLDFGVDCQHDNVKNSHVTVDGMMTTAQASDEEILKQTRDLEQGETSFNFQKQQTTKEWFYEQCVEDRSNGKSNSYACQRAIIEDSYFKRLTLNVDYENISEQVKNLTKKLTLAAKVAFYHNLDVDSKDESSNLEQKNKLKIKAEYLTRFADVPMVDVSIETPKELMIFQKVQTPYFRPVSSLYSIVQVYKNLLTSYKSEDRCTMMEDYLRTFDNVSLELVDSKCQYLLAKDCSTSERFAIFARQIDLQTKTKEVVVYVDGKEIVMTPPTSESVATVRVDGQTVDVSSEQSHLMLAGQMSISLRQTASSTTGSIVELKHNQHELVVKYDGKNVQVQVSSKYRGEMCGICGDNNLESQNEFTGPDQCVYEREEDFINSYALNDNDYCQQTPTINVGTKKCPTKKVSLTQNYYQKQQQKETLSSLMNEWNYTKNQQQKIKSNYLRHVDQDELVHEQERQVQAAMERRQQQQQTRQSQTSANNAIHQQTYPQQYQHQHQHQHQQQSSLVQRLRTMAIKQQDRLCFSTTPILTCIEGYSRPTQIIIQNLGFHCLPSQSIAAQKLVEQSQYQVLEIFGKKSVDFMAPMHVPVACYAI